MLQFTNAYDKANLVGTGWDVQLVHSSACAQFYSQGVRHTWQQGVQNSAQETTRGKMPQCSGFGACRPFPQVLSVADSQAIRHCHHHVHFWHHRCSQRPGCAISTSVTWILLEECFSPTPTWLLWLRALNITSPESLALGTSGD